MLVCIFPFFCRAETIVTVVEGKVMCFDLSEGMPVGALKTGGVYRKDAEGWFVRVNGKY